MKKQSKKIINKKEVNCRASNCGSGSAIYGLGIIGAVVYYISHATSFWMGVLGFFKALVWPAFLIYELLKYLGM